MKTVNYKSIILAILSCLLALLIIEYLTKTYLDVVEGFGHQLTHVRNPLYRRGWVEYTQPTSINTDHLIIIITGSQAWGTELPEPDNIYANILEKQLNQSSSKSFTVLNWGVAGIDFAEYVILMSRLSEYQSDLVFFIVDWRDMTDNLKEPLRNYGTDVVRLAYHPVTRQHLSPAFVDEHEANDPLEFIKNVTYLGMLHSYLLVDVPRQWGDGVAEKAIANRSYGKPNRTELLSWTEDVDWYLANTMGTYLSSIGETPLVAITAPQRLESYNDEDKEKVSSLTSRIQSLWGNIPHVDVVDGTQWIPPETFFDKSHFDEQGHQIMAQKLYEIVINKIVLTTN